MTGIYNFARGTLPLLISIPHDGRVLMPEQSLDMTKVGKEIPDTDWHVRKLYSFTEKFGASMIGANYSRYTVDLNRPPDDAVLYDSQLFTGLCPIRTFDGDSIYRDAFEISDLERKRRVHTYWIPYHEKIRTTLEEIRHEFGYALLWDAHSIRIWIFYDTPEIPERRRTR